MASTTSYILFLSIFSSAFALGAAQQRQSNISLDSSLRPTANPTSWLSPSGRFAFGFYPEGGGFFVGIWLVTSDENTTIIWTADRDSPPVSKDAVLKLTLKGLELEERLISQFSTDSYASSASMLDSGNFIIYGSNSSVVWQTFDIPTDTMMGGQVLSNESQLISSSSETNHSSGKFRLKMQNDGNLVMYPVETFDVAEDAYWASGTNGDGILILNLSDDGRLYLLGANFTKDIRAAYKSKPTLVYRARLDIDGRFKLYCHDFKSNKTDVLDVLPDATDQCNVKGTCGLNSYCNSTAGAAVCSCLPGFDYIDANRTSIGCSRIFTSNGCYSNNNSLMESMSILENVGWADDPYALPLSDTSNEDCQKECLEDCNCDAALFKDNQCSKQKFPLKYGRKDEQDSTTTFIKVVAINPEGGRVREVIIKKVYRTKILVVSLAIIAGLVCIIAVLTLFIYRKQAGSNRKRMGIRDSELGLVDEIAPRCFSYHELMKATDGFKEELGKGAFGTVFKGSLSDGTERAIAVKRLERLADEGEREFRTEMRSIGRTHHKNLVRLLGFCDEGPNRLLVYEYMSNGSLADIIFRTERRPHWDDRARIALDIARGIHYLHEECDTRIIHCDIKPQNILMDGNWTAKISDFGLAKLLMPSQTRTIFTRIRGTRGYLAPEWHKNAPITVKADVYSFGIVLLEIVCCRKNMDLEAEVDAIVLLDWVYECFLSGELEKLVPDEVDTAELNRLVKVGIWCTQSNPAFRPAMKNVVMMLEGNIDVALPPPPNSS